MRLKTVLLLLLATRAAAQGTSADSAFARQDWPAVVAAYSNITSSEPRNGMAWFRLGAGFHALGRYSDAIRAYERGDSLNYQRIPTLYRLSRAHALMKNPVKAVEYLQKVVQMGYAQPTHFAAQKDFDGIRNDPGYKALIARVEATRFPCRGADPSRQFDFWIGEWDVYPWSPSAPNAAAPPAESKIESLLEHCVTVENWSTAGGDGKSWNYYDRASKKWRQHWMSDNGIAHDYTGEFRDGAMRFLSAPVTTDGKSTIMRMTFTPIHRDTVRQLIESSTDSGKTWVLSFDGKYVRRKQKGDSTVARNH
jgi:tetratricopeptide (TPR) repeat protein